MMTTLTAKKNDKTESTKPETNSKKNVDDSNDLQKLSDKCYKIDKNITGIQNSLVLSALHLHKLGHTDLMRKLYSCVHKLTLQKDALRAIVEALYKK